MPRRESLAAKAPAVAHRFGGHGQAGIRREAAVDGEDFAAGGVGVHQELGADDLHAVKVLVEAEVNLAELVGAYFRDPQILGAGGAELGDRQILDESFGGEGEQGLVLGTAEGFGRQRIDEAEAAFEEGRNSVRLADDIRFSEAEHREHQHHREVNQ